MNKGLVFIRRFTLKGLPVKGTEIRIEGDDLFALVFNGVLGKTIVLAHDKKSSAMVDVEGLSYLERKVILFRELKFVKHIEDTIGTIEGYCKDGHLPHEPGNAADAIVSALQRSNPDFDWSQWLVFESEEAKEPEVPAADVSDVADDEDEESFGDETAPPIDEIKTQDQPPPPPPLLRSTSPRPPSLVIEPATTATTSGQHPVIGVGSVPNYADKTPDDVAAAEKRAVSEGVAALLADGQSKK